MGAARPQLQDEHPQEPWLRGTLSDIAPVERAVLHSLQLAREDVAKWCGRLDEHQLHARLLGLPSAAFQLRHIARSLDRFITYAEGQMLSAAQLAALANETADEQATDASKEEVFREFEFSLSAAEQWLRATSGRPLDTPVRVGRRALPTTRGGLLVHMAEHTQRHVGQAVTTAKVQAARRAAVV
jgi:uncharacterized damage-inducible protein DinB